MAAATGVLAWSLVACSGGQDDPEAGKSSKEPSTQESVDPAKVSPVGLPDIPKVKRERGAIQDLSLGDCATEAGKQTVKGTITSSAKKTVDYLVTVSWTTGAGDVMGRGVEVLKDVKPDATEKFKITAKVAEGATLCVQGASYGRIG
ncbi:MAG: hypothetical protein ACRCYU_19635 [Nocardioides sp.]